MPLKRDSQGRIIHTSDDDFDAPTVKGGGTGGGDDFDQPTVAVGDNPGGSDIATVGAFPAASTPEDDLDPATRIAAPAKPVGDDSPAPAADPVAGWLVVINGAGRGEALRLGFGRNTIGRGADNRVVLNFGDEEISRTGHCAVTFDGRGGRFYLTHGEGSNLTYFAADGHCDEAPVLQPVELFKDARITIGETTLRFIPFCDDSFSWNGSE